MGDIQEGIEQQVEAMILAGLAQSEGNAHDTTKDDTGERTVIDVDLYRLEGGAVLLVPNNGTNPLDENAIDSAASTPQEPETPTTAAPSVPLDDEEPQEEVELPQDAQPEPPAPTSTKRRIQPSFVLVPLVLLCTLAAGAASYWYLLPLTATATVTITPKVKSLHTATTFTIAASPTAGQVQGRPLAAISLTRSKTVPATGHAHDDATAAAGIITFYNADSSAYTIPAGVTFTTQNGQTIVTDTTVSVQAAILPEVGSAIASAHVVQAGSAGNIAAHSIYTRCCGSEFITATNTSAFSGGQDARSYSFIQSSDIHNAASDLLKRLTFQATAALQKEMRQGEQLVTPFCTPRTQENAEPGTEGTSVTVSVTQTCSSVAYQLASLQQVATSTLAQSVNLATYQQEGSVQVTVNGSTSTNHTALLHVYLSGVWLYRFTQAKLTQLTHLIAGENQATAKATLEKTEGVARVSIQLQRFDFRASLPADPQHISIQFFSIIP